MRGRWAGALLGGLLLAAADGRAAVTQYWTLETPEDFLKFKTRGAALGGDARAALGPSVDSLGDTGEPMVWAVVAGSGSVAYAGTGHSGKIFRSEAGGRVREWAATGEAEVLSLAPDGAGGVYAGTGPKGKVFHVDARGKVSLFAQLDAEYVWALLGWNDGSLFAATGAQGRIFKIGRDGKAQTWWDSPSGHVLCLARGPKGELLAGGEESGVLYEVTGLGHGRALFDSGEQEIRSVAVTPSGQIYVAALKVALQLPSGGGPTVVAGPPTIAGDKGGSRSVLYRLLPNGAGVRVWDGPGLMYSILPDGDGILAALGEDSQLWRFDAQGAGVRLADFDAGSILSLARAADGWILGTANPGQVLHISARPRASATLESTTLDGRRVAAWGGLFATASPQSGVSFSVRSGNSDPPDAGWSEWTPYRSGNISAPPARYLQWRAELHGGATLRRVRVAWREQNLPPEIRSVQILPQEPRALSGPPEGGGTVSQTLSSGVRVDYSLPRQSQRPSSFDVAAWARGVRTIRWDASDPNTDPLDYSLQYREVGETRWKPLASNLDEVLYAWDTTSLPDGSYEIRVNAADSAQNVPSEALIASRVSEPTTIDHTPPRWSAAAATRGAGGRLNLSGGAHDDLSPLVYLGYSLDGGPWMVVQPVDGILDSPDETARFEILGVGPGEHTVTLKAVDLSGNVGSTSVTVR